MKERRKSDEGSNINQRKSPQVKKSSQEISLASIYCRSAGRSLKSLLMFHLERGSHALNVTRSSETRQSLTGPPPFLTLIIRSEIEPCRHFEDLHQPGEFPCPGDEKLCGKVFTSRNKMSSHYSRWEKLIKGGSQNENSFLGTATLTILPAPKPSQEEELRLDYDSLSSWNVSKLSDFQLPL